MGKVLKFDYELIGAGGEKYDAQHGVKGGLYCVAEGSSEGYAIARQSCQIRRVFGQTPAQLEVYQEGQPGQAHH
jgi:hypothetical protein